MISASPHAYGQYVDIKVGVTPSDYTELVNIWKLK